jgi:CheY-like chemotaxis protein
MPDVQVDRKLILLVEDDPDWAAAMAMIIEDAGMETVAADNADQALVLHAARKPDLVILDIRIKGESGLVLYSRLRRHENGRQVPVVFISGFGVAEDFSGPRFHKLHGPDLPPPQGFLPKPVKPQALVNMVSGLLATR